MERFFRCKYQNYLSHAEAMIILAASCLNILRTLRINAMVQEYRTAKDLRVVCQSFRERKASSALALSSHSLNGRSSIVI